MFIVTITDNRKARILLILQLSRDALATGEILTKRHIFYQHQDLFESQRVVDELVDCLAATLNLDRDDLNIVASSKGVWCGSMAITLNDGSMLHGDSPGPGVPIPMTRTIETLDTTSLKWVLVVEKDVSRITVHVKPRTHICTGSISIPILFEVLGEFRPRLWSDHHRQGLSRLTVAIVLATDPYPRPKSTDSDSCRL